jgi:hypothetical protein
MSATQTVPASSVEHTGRLCIHAIRVLSMDAVPQADSGRPGKPMALGALAYAVRNGSGNHIFAHDAMGGGEDDPTNANKIPLLVFPRQPLPTFDRPGHPAASGLARDAYVLTDAGREPLGRP